MCGVRCEKERSEEISPIVVDLKILFFEAENLQENN